MVQDAQGKFVGRTAGNGQLAFSCKPPCRVQVQAEGFALRAIEMTGDTSITLQPATAFEQTTVTAYRAPLGELQSPCQHATAHGNHAANRCERQHGGKMRQVPGVELFRRSSSLVANPSSQGISLPRLGSTSASRTLISLDDVPLNDPVGGWIHWEEQAGPCRAQRGT